MRFSIKNHVLPVAGAMVFGVVQAHATDCSALYQTELNNCVQETQLCMSQGYSLPACNANPYIVACKADAQYDYQTCKNPSSGYPPPTDPGPPPPGIALCQGDSDDPPSCWGWEAQNRMDQLINRLQKPKIELAELFARPLRRPIRPI